MCPKCGKEFSPKVWKIHVKRCRADEVPEEVPFVDELPVDDVIVEMNNPYEDMETEALRELAKERGINNYWNRSRETLEEELLKD